MVVTIGEVMILLQPFMGGAIAHAALFDKSIAGAEANVAIGLSRLGQPARYITRLGQDGFGDYILATLQMEQVDTSFITRHEQPTGVFFKENRGVGDPSVYYYRRGSAASTMTSGDVKDEWFEGATILHVSGITPALSDNCLEMVQAAMQKARHLGLIVSFDPNLRRKLWSDTEARKTLLSLIPLCDIFLPGDSEAEFLLPEEPSHERRLDNFLRAGAHVAALKCGASGSLVATIESTASVHAVPVSHIVDTVGAGDAFAAGFLSVVLETLESSQSERPSVQTPREAFSSLPFDVFTRAALRGNLMGALALTFRGDWEGLPVRAQLLNLEGQSEAPVSR